MSPARMIWPLFSTKGPAVARNVMLNAGTLIEISLLFERLLIPSNTNESPVCGGALPPVQFPGLLQLTLAFPVQVSVAASTVDRCSKIELAAIRSMEIERIGLRRLM